MSPAPNMLVHGSHTASHTAAAAAAGTGPRELDYIIDEKNNDENNENGQDTVSGGGGGGGGTASSSGSVNSSTGSSSGGGNLNGQPAQKQRLKAYAKPIHIFCLCLLMFITGDFVSWNTTLAAGFGSGLIGCLLIGIAYVSLMYCMSELSSAVPFSGGSWGFARVTFGHTYSVFVGLSELLDYLLLHVIGAISASSMITTITSTDPQKAPLLEGLWSFLIYVVWNLFLYFGGGIFWTVIILGFVVCYLFLVFYYLSCWTSPSFNFLNNVLMGDAYAASMNYSFVPSNFDNYFTPNLVPVPASLSFLDSTTSSAAGFFSILPACIWWYAGIECSPLATEECQDPKTTVARGSIPAAYFGVFMGLTTLFTGVGINSIYDLSGTLYPSPLSQGLSTVFPPVSDAVSAFSLNWFNVFACVTLIWNGMSCMFASGRVIYCLSRAGQMPKILSFTNKNGVPYIANIVSSVIGFTICLIVRYVRIQGQADDGSDGANAPLFLQLQAIIFNLFVLASSMLYLAVLACFLKLRVSLKFIPRLYRSPLNIPGAVVSGCIFTISFFSLILYGPYILDCIYILIAWYSFGFAYYMFIGRHMLAKRSPEEVYARYMYITAEKMLRTGLGIAYIRMYSKQEYNSEIIDCWSDSMEYVESAPALNPALFHELFITYFSNDAHRQVNLPSERISAFNRVYEQIDLFISEKMHGSLADAYEQYMLSTKKQHRQRTNDDEQKASTNNHHVRNKLSSDMKMNINELESVKTDLFTRTDAPLRSGALRTTDSSPFNKLGLRTDSPVAGAAAAAKDRDHILMNVNSPIPNQPDRSSIDYASVPSPTGNGMRKSTAPTALNTPKRISIFAHPEEEEEEEELQLATAAGTPKSADGDLVALTLTSTSSSSSSSSPKITPVVIENVRVTSPSHKKQPSMGRQPSMARVNYLTNSELNALLAELTLPLVKLVISELVALMNVNTLPRFKASPLFQKYVAQEPLELAR